MTTSLAGQQDHGLQWQKSFEFSPAGFVTAQYVRGKNGEVTT
jgi:hypothetical protein